MRFTFWMLMFVLCADYHLSHAQANAIEIPIQLGLVHQDDWVQDFNIPKIGEHEFIALSIVLEGRGISSENVNIQLTTKAQKHDLLTFEEDPLQVDKYVSELVYIRPNEFGEAQLSIELSVPLDIKEVSGKIRLFYPNIGNTLRTNMVKPMVEYRTACSCPQPEYISRADWGSSFKLNGNIYLPPATYTNVTHLIIHHSAGTNTSNNWSSVVASIFDFHVNSNGWQDVGYNWLIDPNGVIYEGRGGGDDVRGAHMCGYNNNTMGVCILGNFELVEPSNAAILALNKLLIWKACKEDITTDGSSNIVSYSGHMHNISGHKDGCSPNYTSCPGINLYEKLDSIRTIATIYSNNSCLKPAGIDDISTPFLIFPNPTSDKVIIRGGSNWAEGNIKIFNTSGNQMPIEYTNLVKHELNISNFQAGIYILTIENKKQVWRQKIIKL